MASGGGRRQRTLAEIADAALSQAASTIGATVARVDCNDCAPKVPGGPVDWKHPSLARFEYAVFNSSWFLSLPIGVKSLMLRYPPWKFYRDKQSGVPVRVLFVQSVQNGLPRLWTVAALLMVGNANARQPKDLDWVDQWTPDDHARFATYGAMAGAWTDPMCYESYITDQERQRANAGV